jgi:hypothetical protein
MSMAFDLRSIAVRLGQIVARVRLFVSRRRVRPKDLRNAADALNRLRRRYVFGAVTREAYDAEMSVHQHRRPWQRRFRTKKVPPVE